MADKLYGGYPASIGNKTASMLRHVGPASYTVVSPGTTPTGGDAILPSAFGLKFIEYMAPAVSEDGAYFVMPVPVGNKLGQYLLRWFVIAGGPPAAMLEVTAAAPLSSYAVHLYAIGLP